jgi:hypothetical protein
MQEIWGAAGRGKPSAHSRRLHGFAHVVNIKPGNLVRTQPNAIVTGCYQPKFYYFANLATLLDEFAAPPNPSMTWVTSPTPPSETVVILWIIAPFNPEVGTSMALFSFTAGLTLK